MDAAVVPGQPHPHQLEQRGIDRGLAAVDVPDEAPGGVEQARTARHGQEEVVVVVGVLPPAFEPALELLAQLGGVGLGKESALRERSLIQQLAIEMPELLDANFIFDPQRQS